MNSCDVIVVGAGSVGCVVAMRLARDFGLRVLLCETAARESVASPVSEDRRRPARWLRLLGSSDDYHFATEPCRELAGRSIQWPRGRGVGGSSRLNAMIWHEPTHHDCESMERASGGTIRSGELKAAVKEIESLVRPEWPRWLSSTAECFISAMRRRADQETSPIAAYRRFNRNGQRWTTEELLRPMEIEPRDPRGSIEILRGTVDQILWRDRQAVGVQIGRNDQSTCEYARRGVVLCAGAIATPTLMVRSGIGPESTLSQLKIPRIAVGDAVGRGLQDHLVMPIIYETDPARLFTDDVSLRDLCRWQVTGGGPLACNIAECGGLVADGRFQLHVTPTNYLKFPRSTVESAMTIAVNVAQPKSRGEIRCVSRDPDAPPQIDAGYLTHPHDVDELLDGIAWVRDLVSQSEISEFVSRELIPGASRADRASLMKSMTRYVQTLYHPTGTCAMSCDGDGVVDAGFRVRGTEQLWIADGSILPQITQANPSVTLLALGWIAAQSIAETR